MSREEKTDSTQAVIRKNRVPAVPEMLWTPLAAGVLTLIPGVIGLATGQPLLFPSLAPTAALQAAQPQLPVSRFYNVVIGHLIGIVAAYACVFVLQASAEPAVFTSHHLFAHRVLASAIAVALAELVQRQVKALHPPAAATVLLITLGGFKPTLHDVVVLAIGVLIVAVAGEAVRQLRLLQPGQK